MSEIHYQQNGDYLIPEITLDSQPQQPLGKYGRMRKKYLQEHRPILFNRFVLNGQLQSHLLEIEETANRRMEQLMTELAVKNGATEKLKTEDQLAWVGLMNNLRNEAEEMILTELIYA
ncbi:MAG: TnpV protein [Clostridia bacterium]|nr:TnpV protein [Clostridia bacterium]